MSELLLDRETPGVCVVTLNRAQARNALTTNTQEALDTVLGDLACDDGVRAIVLTGAGSEAFSAGYDIKELSAFDERETLSNYLERQLLLWNITIHPKPLIGAINGVAHGAGAIIASLLDIRIGSARSAFRFTAAAYGGVNNTWQLPAIVGMPKAMELTMTARAVAGEEAFKCGLLNQIVEPELTLSTAIDVAAGIACHPPAAIRWHKTLIRNNVAAGLREAFDAENTVMENQSQPGKPAELFEAFLTSRPKR